MLYHSSKCKIEKERRANSESVPPLAAGDPARLPRNGVPQSQAGGGFIRWSARQKNIWTYASSVCTLPLVALSAAVALHDKLAAVNIHIPTLALLLVLFLAVWGIGEILFRCGMPQAEGKFAMEINPEWQEMKEDIKAVKGGAKGQ